MTLTIVPVEKDLGRFQVRRLLPHIKQQMVGPWIFFDHMGPATFKAGKGIDVRPHPHINLATVTYLFDGEILHRDSVGSEQIIRPGDINLMVAGRGITHSEREPHHIRNSDHQLHGLQLWHALPEDQEDIEPAFYHYPSDSIPSLSFGTTQVRVMMGEAYGLTSPVKTFTRTLYVEADIPAGNELQLPQAQEIAVYIASGEAMVAEEVLPQYSMLVARSTMVIHATQASRIAIIGGDKMTPRFIEWNFVSSRQERIEKAKRDWKAGRFPKVKGDEVEFIPLP